MSAIQPSVDDDDFQPAELVRVFSMGIKAKYGIESDEESEIEKAVVEDFDDKERRRKRRLREIEEYLEATQPHELRELYRKRQGLELAMKEFCACVQKRLAGDLPAKIESWQDVASVVDKVVARLERKQEKSKFRRATKHLRSFCNTVKAHSTALKMLPSTNEYVSVFYGALPTVIQASESYSKVMDVLPQAMIDINDAVSAIEKRLWLFDNDTMKSYAWRMYSQIFSFLGDIIRWYTKRSYQRLMSSFNEHLPEFFEDQVEEIKKSAELIYHDAHLRSQADAQMSRLYLEGLDSKVDKLMLELRERDRRSQDATDQRYENFCAMLEEMRRKELQDRPALEDALQNVWMRLARAMTGSAVAEILESHAQPRLQLMPGGDDVQSPERRVEQDQPCPESEHIQPATLEPTPQPDRDTLLLHSAKMESFHDRENVQPALDHPETLSIGSDLASSIRAWATAPDPRALCVAGMDALPPDENPAASAASQYVSFAREAGLPLCSYFCRLQSAEPPPGRTRETMELTALVYSLVRQLIELLPPGGVSSASGTGTGTGTAARFGKERFDALEGTLDTFPEALRLLDDLLGATGHAVLIVVVVGLDMLNDLAYGSTEVALKTLVDVLLRHVYGEHEGVVKILFSCGGVSAPLFEALTYDQILLLSAPQMSGGRPAAGTEPMML